MISYYPEEFNINKIIKAYPELEMVYEDEEERLADVTERRKRGKGAPKKAKTKGGRLFFDFPFFGRLIVFLSFFFQLIVEGCIRNDERHYRAFFYCWNLIFTNGAIATAILSTYKQLIYINIHFIAWLQRTCIGSQLGFPSRNGNLQSKLVAGPTFKCYSARPKS